MIAIDTEFVGPQTLTVQAATRLGTDAVAARLYLHPDLPTPPSGFADGLPTDYPGRVGRLALRDPGMLTADLGPVDYLADLLGLDDVTPWSRHAVAAAVPAPAPEPGSTGHPTFPNVTWVPEADGWWVPEVRVVFVGHFLRADFGRLFGSRFAAAMRRGGPGGRPLRLAGGKVLRYSTGAGPGPDPVLQYFTRGTDLYAVRVGFSDTMLPYGPGGLDRLARTFLGVGKSDRLTPAEKADTAATIRARPADAYRYALADAATTLLVHESMDAEDRRLFAAVGLARAGGMRATLGGRARALYTAAARRACGATGPADVAALNRLMRAGGLDLLDPPHASKFGEQMLGVPGGLLYTRSPDRFWHEAAGRFRDADLKGCYATALAGMDVYLGRPVVFEPGDAPWTLAEAVAFARRHADPDGWLVRVSGSIDGYQNALIPSADGAVTTARYRRARPRRGDDRRGRGHRLYTGAVEFGTVTDATWRVTRMLPPAARAQYKGLRVDALVLYPRKLAAGTPEEYRALVSRYRGRPVPWEQELDLRRMRVTERRPIDDAFVSFRFPVRELAARLSDLLAEARARDGKGSGAELALKATLNTLYGVLASPHFPTFNVMAANQVTARARAVAFVLGQALNGIQTITDGLTYRADQVPATRYAECLAAKPNYPVPRAEAGDGIPFRRPGAVPGDDAAFNTWLVRHLAWFFGATHKAVRELLAGQAVEHKPGPDGGVGFDALACDGPGNYIKCRRVPGGGLDPFAVALRVYNRGDRDDLIQYLVNTYSADRMAALPPVLTDTDLLSADRAMQAARRHLRSGYPTLLPLGMAAGRVKAYTLLKPAGLLFRTPAQRDRVVRQLDRFGERYGCGLELLALRRGYGDRPTGSVAGLARRLVDYVEGGGDRVLAVLNAGEVGDDLEAVAEARAADRAARKRAADAALRRLVVAGLHARTDQPVTGILLGPGDEEFVLGSDGGRGLRV